MLKSQSRSAPPRAVFSCQSYGNVIAVIDHDQGRSVTNDAEAVIVQLVKEFDLAKYRIIYRDTRGIWDELQVQDGRFAGFRGIDERDLEAALAKVQATAPARSPPGGLPGRPSFPAP